ncbi:hypothetical protein H9P43_006242 [Blastocladiella emersonii ATCC 22665]|nr:hypothetical protein H9P43_006242 [Blastocladiella emersonii ATCC 22665]
MTTTDDFPTGDSHSTLPPAYSTLDPAAAKAKATGDVKSATTLEASSCSDLATTHNLVRTDTGAFDLSTLPAGATVSIKSEAAGRITLVTSPAASTELTYTVEHFLAPRSTAEIPLPRVDLSGSPAAWTLTATPAAPLPPAFQWMSHIFIPHSPKYRAHVTLTVPARATAALVLDVAATNASVHLTGNTTHAWHAVRLATTKGAITVTAPVCVANGGFRACLTNGDIRVASVTAAAGGEVAGKAVNGTVHFDAVHLTGAAVLDSNTVNGDVHTAVVGAAGEMPAGSAVHAATVNGNITLAVPRPVVGAVKYSVAAVSGVLRVGGEKVKGRKGTGRVEGGKGAGEYEVEVGAAAVNGNVTIELTE